MKDISLKFCYTLIKEILLTYILQWQQCRIFHAYDGQDHSNHNQVIKMRDKHSNTT